MKFKPLTLGPLPVEPLRRFGLDVSEGSVHFGIPGQKHAQRRHPHDFDICFPHLSDTVCAPTHVGQSPHHTDDGFELVREIRDGQLIILVAALLKPTKHGVHLVTSTYRIDSRKLERRLETGHLIEV